MLKATEPLLFTHTSRVCVVLISLADTQRPARLPPLVRVGASVCPPGARLGDLEENASSPPSRRTPASAPSPFPARSRKSTPPPIKFIIYPRSHLFPPLPRGGASVSVRCPPRGGGAREALFAAVAPHPRLHPSCEVPRTYRSTTPLYTVHLCALTRVRVRCHDLRPLRTHPRTIHRTHCTLFHVHVLLQGLHRPLLLSNEVCRHFHLCLHRLCRLPSVWARHGLRELGVPRPEQRRLVVQVL